MKPGFGEFSATISSRIKSFHQFNDKNNKNLQKYKKIITYSFRNLQKRESYKPFQENLWPLRLFIYNYIATKHKIQPPTPPFLTFSDTPAGEGGTSFPFFIPCLVQKQDQQEQRNQERVRVPENVLDNIPPPLPGSSSGR